MDVTYPENLPVSAAKDEIAEAIRDNQVVIVAGETGSGKTTQLPKICLELGLGVNGLIGHTQPRRIAARTVAERIADELGEDLGGTIGYQVRFTAQVADSTRVKVMTDGILLSELSRDKLLRDYEVIIIDEAHERSLNIDFLLGYLKEVMGKRPELKVIITSATIDPQSFAAHFDDAPIIEVAGRTYPVEVRYRPLVDDDEDDDVDGPGESGSYETGPEEQTEGIIAAFDELSTEAPGDILVFLSGEREIRDTAEALEAHLRKRPRLSNWEVVPLFARLSAGEQQKVFKPHSRPRLVLATNVAETSLDRPRHQIRHRRRHRPHLPVLQPHPRPTPADRTHLPGECEPAQGPVGTHQRRHLHPPVLGNRLRLTPRIHRPGDPAHEPGQRHPADDRPRIRGQRQRDPRFPVPHPAGGQGRP